jgi:hypothetical protein
MTQEDQAWPDLFGVGARTIVEQAKRLGLTWGLRMGTVTGTTGTSQFQVRMDRDTVSIPVTSMTGPVLLNDRVYILSIPPSGNFLIGTVTRIFPGQRIATSTRTASVGTFTAETVIDTLVAPLITGKTYMLTWYGRLFKDVADGIARFRIREDSISGTVLAISQLYTTVTINQSFPTIIKVQYTAVATGDKTFVTTANRQTGTGNLTAQAAADTVAYFYIEYVEG